MKPVDLVAAIDARRGLGRNGDLVWHLPTDLQYFVRLTSLPPRERTINAVLMGRKTWESIPSKWRPLKNRLNVVLSRQTESEVPDGVKLCSNFEDALSICQDYPGIGRIFIVGGASIYEAALHHELCRFVFLTRIQFDFDCDTFFPDFENQVRLLHRSALHKENDLQFTFDVYRKL